MTVVARHNAGSAAAVLLVLAYAVLVKPRSRFGALILAGFLALFAMPECKYGPPDEPPDAGVDSGSLADSGPDDGGGVYDSGVPIDAGVEDAGLPDAGKPDVGPVDIDCRNDASCPQVTIAGDPMAYVPGYGLAPWRGFADPSIRRDPLTGRLWLSYAYVDMDAVAASDGGQPLVDRSVSIHLARSDDDGGSFTFEKKLWPVVPATNPHDGGAGYLNHEISNLVRRQNGGSAEWLGIYLRGFQPLGPEEYDIRTFHLRLAGAPSPPALAATEESVLTSPATDSAWASGTNLSTLDPELGACAMWIEPGLMEWGGTLYLLAQCLVVSQGSRMPAQEFLGVFAAAGGSAVSAMSWRWVGKLSTFADAVDLQASFLTQGDLALARDGSLLLVATPTTLAGSTETHLGCAVIEVDSLEPPALRRDGSGRALVRAKVRSSDSMAGGPGACAYERSSATGILMVRRELHTNPVELVWTLHATGVHP